MQRHFLSEHFEIRNTVDHVWTVRAFDVSIYAPRSPLRRRIIMKVLRLFSKVICCLAVCVALSRADSIQLRNGRRLQGKYVGGTTTAVGFMTAGTVEYFATSEVLVLMFDGGNDTPGEGLQPNPMNQRFPDQPSMYPRQTTASILDSSPACGTMDGHDADEWLTDVQGLAWLRSSDERPASSML